METYEILIIHALFMDQGIREWVVMSSVDFPVVGKMTLLVNINGILNVWRLKAATEAKGGLLDAHASFFELFNFRFIANYAEN